MGGDFNTSDIDWDSVAVKPDSRHKALHDKLLSVLGDHHLSQMQREPTRDSNILDLFLVNKPGCVKNVTTIPGISDHTGIILTDCDIKPTFPKSQPREISLFSRANWEAMKEETVAFQQKFVEEIGNKDIDTCWDEFKRHIDSIIAKYVPTKKSSRRYNLPWLTGDLKRMCRKQHRWFKKAHRTGHPADKKRHKKLQRDTAKSIRKAHWDFVNNILCESLANHDSKPFWKYVKSKRHENNGVSPLMKNGTLHSDSAAKANILNSQFQSVFTPDDGTETPRLEGESYPEINRLVITQEGVRKLLDKINPNKASGPDNIPGRVLKELATEIAPVLTVIFQRSLDTGTLPTTWTQANITPIYKKGSKHAAENYRPVSLTCIC